MVFSVSSPQVDFPFLILITVRPVLFHLVPRMTYSAIVCPVVVRGGTSNIIGRANEVAGKEMDGPLGQTDYDWREAVHSGVRSKDRGCTTIFSPAAQIRRATIVVKSSKATWHTHSFE